MFIFIPFSWEKCFFKSTDIFKRKKKKKVLNCASDISLLVFFIKKGKTARRAQRFPKIASRPLMVCYVQWGTFGGLCAVYFLLAMKLNCAIFFCKARLTLSVFAWAGQPIHLFSLCPVHRTTLVPCAVRCIALHAFVCI